MRKEVRMECCVSAAKKLEKNYKLCEVQKTKREDKQNEP